MSISAEHYTREALVQEGQLWRQDLAVTQQRVIDALHCEPDPRLLYQTLAKIDEVYRDNFSPIKPPQREFAFMVHPRDPIDNDIQRQFPVFTPEYMSPEAIDGLFRDMPPMRLGEYNGLEDEDGRQVNGYIVSAPITVQGLYLNGRDGIVDARKKVIETARFAHDRLGTKVIGTGLTLAPISKFGTAIEKEITDLNVTTGHGATVYLVGETLKNGANAVGVDMKKSRLAVIGAAGAIGSSAAEYLASEVGHVTLIDVGPMVPRLESVATRLNGASVDISSDIHALTQADLIISATSNPEPFITRDNIKKGAVIVDDSQPVNMTEKEAQIAGALLLHPIAQLPKGVERDFDFSLPQRIAHIDDFSCAAEAMAIAQTRQYDSRTIGRLEDVEQVRRIANLLKQTGVKAAPMQSFGHIIPQSYIEYVRAFRNER